VLPTQCDSNKAYPAVLAFGGGPQTMEAVEGTLRRNCREQAEQRGYLMIALAAPDGDLLFEQGARIFPEFLTKIFVGQRHALPFEHASYCLGAASLAATASLLATRAAVTLGRQKLASASSSSLGR